MEEYIAVSQKPLLKNYIVEGINSQGGRTGLMKLSNNQESTLDCEAWIQRQCNRFAPEQERQ